MKNGRKLFTISFTGLLGQVVQWYGLPRPLYRQYYKAKKDKYKVVVKLTMRKEDLPIKVYSKLHKDIAQASEDAAKQLVKIIQQTHNFDV